MRRILVVDDAAEIAQMWVMMLHQGGYFALPVTSGYEALDQHAKWRAAGKGFDLILLDLAMSGMNGFEVADRIKAVDPEMKIVFLTAYDEPMSVRRATVVEAPVWSKPLMQEELLALVAESFD
jgi:CheY-like chemotaxis protein